MNVQEEKSYIYGMMKDITQERRKLTDIYYGLKERLDFLNIMEQRGIEDLSLKGYADLHNQNQKEAVINNMKREVEHQIQKIENHHIIEESEKSVIPKDEIVRQKRKNRKGLVSKEKISGAVIEVLKDAGTPVKLSDLLDKVNDMLENNISKGNFQTNLLPRIMENNKKIEKPMRGFYQYRGF